MQTIEMVRLIADDGKALSNGKVLAACVDCCPASEADNWSEIDMPLGLKFNRDSTGFEEPPTEDDIIEGESTTPVKESDPVTVEPAKEAQVSEAATVEAVSTVDGES